MFHTFPYIPWNIYVRVDMDMECNKRQNRWGGRVMCQGFLALAGTYFACQNNRSGDWGLQTNEQINPVRDRLPLVNGCWVYVLTVSV